MSDGFRVIVQWDKESQYSIEYNENKFQLFDREDLLIDDINFDKRPNYYSQNTSDGTPMATVAQSYGYNHLFVAYSNECSLKDKGKDCLFCNV